VCLVRRQRSAVGESGQLKTAQYPKERRATRYLAVACTGQRARQDRRATHLTTNRGLTSWRQHAGLFGWRIAAADANVSTPVACVIGDACQAQKWCGLRQSVR